MNILHIFEIKFHIEINNIYIFVQYNSKYSLKTIYSSWFL
jgi:hypothetical protein